MKIRALRYGIFFYYMPTESSGEGGRLKINIYTTCLFTTLPKWWSSNLWKILMFRYTIISSSDPDL